MSTTLATASAEQLPALDPTPELPGSMTPLPREPTPPSRAPRSTRSMQGPASPRPHASPPDSAFPAAAHRDRSEGTCERAPGFVFGRTAVKARRRDRRVSKWGGAMRPLGEECPFGAASRNRGL
jgi:hypothetical protein